MSGRFLSVWSDSWNYLWLPLRDVDAAPEDLFCELYRDLSEVLIPVPSVEELAEIIDDPQQSETAFESVTADMLADEVRLIAFLETAFETLDDLGGDALANAYFNLLESFVERFGLRYDLRRPCIICPTLPGLFNELVADLRRVAFADAHLDGLVKDFENAVRDLRVDAEEARIKTCIQKQVNLLEGLGARCPGVTADTLGAMCEQVGTWPHQRVMTALKDVYKFSCNYPGIRHGGDPDSALRAIEMRDMIAISILLAGFVPYLQQPFDGDRIFMGA